MKLKIKTKKLNPAKLTKKGIIGKLKRGYILSKQKKEHVKTVYLPEGVVIPPVPYPEYRPRPGVVKEEKPEEEPTEEKVEGVEILESLKLGGRPLKLEEERETLKYTDIKYPLIPRDPAEGEQIFAYCHIRWDPNTNNLVYDIIEPEISQTEKEIIEKVKIDLEERLDIDFTKLGDVQAKSVLVGEIQKSLALIGRVDPERFVILTYYIERDIIGLGKIEPLMRDPNIEDISCDGVMIPIYVYHRDPRIASLRTNILFFDNDELNDFISRLSQKCSKTISIAEPLLDASLPDGSRVQATLGTDIARKGSNFCIKEGYVQMHDGSIEDIRELFLNWKNTYGSRYDEYGNEICSPENTYATGIHQDNLEQEKGRVIQILKLPPPERLVRVSFEECGKAKSFLEVTENHMFHVLTKEGIKLMEANKIKPGLWVPVPAKIEVEGNLSREEFLKKLLDCLSKFGSSEVYVKIDQNLKQYITYSASTSRLKDIKRDKITSIPLSELIKNLQLKGTNIGNLEYLNCILREGKKGRGATIRVPLDLIEDIAYFVGWVIGDGSLTIDNVSIHTGLNEEHKKSLLKVIEELFHLKGKVYKNDKNRTYINSKIIAKILHDVFDIPYSYKSRKVDVPKIIQRSKNKIVSNFLKGLFEADGSFERDINLTTFSKNLATKVIFLLSRLGVYSVFNQDEKAFRIYVPSAYYSKFSKNVFSNNKIVKLVMHQEKTKKSNMLPAFISDLIFKSCKEHGVKSYIIGKILNPSEIRKSGKVSFRKVKIFNELLKRYAENETTKMIDRLLKGDLEFKRISDVKVLNNENIHPVYDLSCNPVNFYIGGKDRPLFVHDTIRKFTERPLTPTHMLKFGTLNSTELAYLWLAIDNGQSVLVSGGSATGKTSLLNALSLFIRPNLKVVSIEDTSELRLPLPHWIPQVARTPLSIEGEVGQISLFDLLKASLRQRPDYIIVGEVRGKEAFVLFQQMATGHSSLATIHAASLPQLIDRLITPPISLPPSLIENVNIVVFLTLSRLHGSYVRRSDSILEIIGIKNDRPLTKRVFQWRPITDIFEITSKSVVLRNLAKRIGVTEDSIQEELIRRKKILEWMLERGIYDYRDVAKVISMYYADPERVMDLTAEV